LPTIRKLRGNTAIRASEDWAGILTRDDTRLESVKEVPAAPPMLWLVLIGASLLAAWRIEGGKRKK